MSELADLRNSVDGMRGDIVAMGQTVAGLDATTKAESGRTREEIRVLFAKNREHEARIGAIEKSYVPRVEQQADMDKNDVAHREFRDGIDDQRSFSGRMGGGIAVAAMAAGAIGAWALTKIG